MLIPAPTPNESDRILALDRYAILDTLPEPEYDAITEIASQICNTPIALISLIDPTRQWFKSHYGLGVQETSRDLAFCAHALHTPEDLLIVPDATQDERFHDNPLTTGDPHVIFYAGAPLTTSDGYPLGTLCVIDRKPGDLTEAQKSALRALAVQVMALLELRLKNRELEAQNREISRLNEELDAFSYRLSHDLKTPIRGIRSLAEWLEEDYWEQLPAQARSWIQQINERADYMGAMTDGLLAHSRMVRMPLKATKFNLRELLAQTFAVAGLERDAVFEQQGTDLNLEHFRVGFQCVFQNLMVNSLRHGTTERCVIHLVCEVSESKLRVVYRDNGPGIPAGFRHKIFGLFETAGGNTRENMGIGLATVASLLRSMGGKISAEDPGQVEGAHFVLEIPRKLVVPSR